MTSPPTQITVICPACGLQYRDWHRASINLDLEGWDPDDPEVQEYLRQCGTATCPACAHIVELGTLVVRGDVWTLSGGGPL